MHLVTRIDIDRCLAVLTVTGPYDPGATFAALRGLSADQRFGRDWGLLVDARGAGEPPAYPDLQRLADAAADPKLLAGRPQALVVSGLLHYGVARQLAALADLRGVPVAVFQNAEEAERWLAWVHRPAARTAAAGVN